MRQFRLRRPSSDEEKAVSLKDRMVGNWQIIFILSFIVAIAFILRAFFAYDYAVSGGFALSGGSDAAYHLRVIEHIMETGSQLTRDEALNYPFGQQNVNPFLMDWIVAIIATPFTLFGVSTTTAATGTLVIITAILGAMTCIPIYLLGRDMFGRNAGIIASLLYAVCSIAIYRTVLSNGTEAAFYGFFFVLMIYFLYKAVKACSNESIIRNKGQMKGYLNSIYRTNAKAVKYAVIAGIMFALVALSWNGFRPIVFMMAFIMIVQVIVDRVRGKDPTAVASVYVITLGLGILISLPFYLLQGLWSLVFSGAFMIALLAMIVTIVISETKGRPWLLVVPITAIAVLVFFIITYFAAPGLFSDMINGNSIYLDPIYESLVGANSVTSLSAMASYYGWLTMWLPYIVVAFFIYKARERLGSASHMFILTWMIAMLAISWRSSSYVFLAAPAYVVGGGAVLAWVIKRADIPSYLSSFKGTGFHFKDAIKKIFKPLPLLTILMAVFLVGAPNAIYAIDASISANEKSEADSGVPDYIGAFNYYVRNDDTWKLNEAWRSMSIVDKSGALVTWGDYSSDAANAGGFETVAGINGAGAAASSNMLLASGDKEIMLAMAVRLMDYYGMETFRSKIPQLSDDEFNKLKDIMENPASYIKEILSDPIKYGKFSSDLTEENAMYVYAIYYLSEVLGFTQNDAIDLYDAVCNACGSSINYIAVSAGMFPITTSDGSFFSTMAYLNNYYLDSNGSPTQFYTANSYGYLNYTDAMYETVLWKAYIGPAPADYGYSSAIEMFNALSLSDGSENTKAQPGFGMPNYQIVYWRVMYNPDSSATLDSDGWVEMDALGSDGAIAKQADQGGLINYMSGLPVILEYVPGGETVSGNVSIDLGSGAGEEGIEGVRVSVFDSDGIQRNTVFTDADGNYSITIPYESGELKFFVGSTTMSDGLEVGSYPLPVASIINILVTPIDINGQLFTDDTNTGELVEGDFTVEIEGAAHGFKETVPMTDGIFSQIKLIPDTYTITIKNANGDTVSTTTIQPTLGRSGSINVKMFLNNATVSLTITDEFNAPFITDTTADTKYIKLENQEANYSTTVPLDEDGKAEVKVVPGTYVATITNEAGGTEDDDYILFNVTFSVAANGSFTLTEKAQRYATLDITNDTGSPTVITITNTVTSTAVLMDAGENLPIKMPTVPSGSGASVKTKYYIYSGTDTVTYDSVDLGEGESLPYSLSSLTTSSAFEFTRTLTASDGSAVAGQVNFYSVDYPDLFISIVTTSNGRMNVWLPAGEYVVYAYSTDSSKVEAFVGNITISGPSNGGALDLVKGKTLTTKVLISTTGTTAIPFVPISITNASGITIETVTDASGQFSHPVPDDGAYTIAVPNAIGSFTPSVSRMTATSAATTLTATFPARVPAIFGPLKIVYGDSNTALPEGTEVEIKLTSESQYRKYKVNDNGMLLDVDDTNGTMLWDLPVGEYNIRLQNSTGFYSSQTVTLSYSGNVDTSSLEKEIKVVKVVKVVLTGLNVTDSTITDVVTITALNDGYISTVSNDASKGEKTYHLEDGKEYIIQVKNADGNEVWYYTEEIKLEDPIDEDNPELRLHVELESAVEIKGYVGHSGTGTVEITYGTIRIVADVSGGNYTVLLPNGKAPYDFETFLNEIEDTGTYEYTGTTTWNTALPESGILNMFVLGKPNETTPDIEITNTPASVTNDVVEFDVTITGNGFQALFLSGGSGWKNIEFSDVTGIIDFINGDGTFHVKATLAEGVAYDSSTLSIIFKNAAGTTITTHVVTDITGTSTDGDLIIGRGETDKSSSSEYNVSILLKNDSKVTRKFTVSVDPAPDGWFAVITDSNGTRIEARDSSYEFTVAGLSETNVYIRLVGITTNSAGDLPESFVVEVKATDGTVAAGEDAEVKDQTARIVEVTMKPFIPTLDLGGHDASGPNIFNDSGSIPIHTWIIIAAAILAFALILWLGMKRGVFTRKK